MNTIKILRLRATALLRRCLWPLVRLVASDRQLCDELLSRTAARLTGPVHATSDWEIRDALYEIGRRIAKRDGRELDLLLNPALPCDKPNAAGQPRDTTP